MGDEISEPVDVVVFFDANMPNMDRCSDNCVHKELIFCAHKFIFRAGIIYPGKSLNNLNDFQVIQYFLKQVRENSNWCKTCGNPIFVLVTKDHNFLQDAEYAYKKIPKLERDATLTFYKNSVKSGAFEVIVEIINCENYGTNRQDNLRCAIRELNKFWKSRQDS